MDEAKHGVIYFSMGSMLKSKTFPDVLKKELLQMFSGLKQTVLWKFEETPRKLPKNVHVVKWAPQQDILGMFYINSLINIVPMNTIKSVCE